MKDEIVVQCASVAYRFDFACPRSGSGQDIDAGAIMLIARWVHAQDGGVVLLFQKEEDNTVAGPMASQTGPVCIM